MSQINWSRVNGILCAAVFILWGAWFGVTAINFISERDLMQQRQGMSSREQMLAAENIMRKLATRVMALATEKNDSALKAVLKDSGVGFTSGGAQ